MNNERYLAADKLIQTYVEDYLLHNQAASKVANTLQKMGIGLKPLIDHITIRTENVELRAKEFLQIGFFEDLTLGVIEHDNWWAKVYRFPGEPAVFIDQAFKGARGAGCVIPGWVKKFGDQTLHHIAINVENIEFAIQRLTHEGLEFTGEITGETESPLRQIFTKPEMRDGVAFSVLELAERKWGYQGFVSKQANSLMESTKVSTH
ncbi:MAG: hypothetical protein SFU91_12190 [Chloroherpetonaceae bacterium]|nr:hypothetical protein [Chloroherpetonaceae bacterium]